MRLPHQLSHRDKGLMCPDCGELYRSDDQGRLFCPWCGDVATIEDMGVRALMRAFPGTLVMLGGDDADRP